MVAEMGTQWRSANVAEPIRKERLFAVLFHPRDREVVFLAGREPDPVGIDCLYVGESNLHAAAGVVGTLEHKSVAVQSQLAGTAFSEVLFVPGGVDHRRVRSIGSGA